MRFSFQLTARFCAVTSAIEPAAALTDTEGLLLNYEISEHEIAGFNDAAGTAISNISALPLRGATCSPQTGSGLVAVEAPAEIVIELDANDEGEAYRAGTDALALYDLEAFLGGYNQAHGTSFQSFVLDDRDDAIVTPIATNFEPVPA